MARSTTKTTFGLTPDAYQPALLRAGFVCNNSSSSLLELLNFKDEVLIAVDMDQESPSSSRVTFHSDIQVEHKGILSFEREENVVTVLCLTELLKKGYLPSDLHLEKTWKLGHRESGRLDICIYEHGTGKNSRISWGMIECKTWKEYLPEQSKMRSNGGQLFSYWIQDRNAKFLYLYSVAFENDELINRSDFIDVSKLDVTSTNVEILHESWDKTFALDGIFHTNARAYDSRERLLLKRDLKTLDQETGTGVFNEFAELLRRHSISDKTNAFNKIFNLFVCKIIDEDEHIDEEEMSFQINGGGDPDEFLDRLDELYRQGLSKYLGINIVPDYVTSAQNFGFLDVFDRNSYLENFKIVRDVVKLLQPYKIKYSTKQQHLGDFFELLLNSGVKQEAGQYFTPVPLTRFAMKSLPLENIVENCIKTGGDALFPRVLDFACGSGHFLTEAMEQIQDVLSSVDSTKIKNSRDRKKLETTRDEFLWTEGNIVGIEKDHRLAKVTKIATFLNGDGEATILHADGLDSFAESNTYKGILKSEVPDSKENPVFDIVVANPPYSVPNFRDGSPASNESFTLLSAISRGGSQIECLFIERTFQALKYGGVAALVLPSGIFSNQTAVYNVTRIFMLKHFKFHAILNLGKNAFMETGISSCIVFLSKRPKDAWNMAESSIENYISGEMNKDPETILDREHALWQHFLKNEKVLIASMDENQQEKDFLGYEFSKRRGQEGIKLYSTSSLYISKQTKQEYLADSVSAPFYLADLIRETYKTCEISDLIEDQKMILDSLPNLIREDLEPIYRKLEYRNTFELLKFSGDSIYIENSNPGLSKSISEIFADTQFKVNTVGYLIETDAVTLNSGKRPTGGVARIRRGIYSLGGEHIEERLGRVDLSKPKYVGKDFYDLQSNLKAHVKNQDVLLCKDGARSGKVALVRTNELSEPAMVNEHVFIFRVTDKGRSTILPEFLFLFFFSEQGRSEMEKSSKGTGAGGISIDRLSDIELLLPDVSEQKKIVDFAETLGLEQGFNFFDVLKSHVKEG